MMIKRMILLAIFCQPGVISAQSFASERIVSMPGFDPEPVKIEPVTRIATPRPITSMDLLTLRDLKGMQISPDGKKVAFVVVQAVYETNSYRSSLFVVDSVPGSVPLNLGTVGPPSFDQVGQISSYPVAWSPDSRYITCLVKQNGLRQIWRWPRAGGKGEQLTHNSADIEEYEWSADGKKISFTTSGSMSAEAAKKVLESGILYDGSIRTWGHETFPRLILEAKPRTKQNWIYEIDNRRERSTTPEEQTTLNKPALPQLESGKYILKSKLSNDRASQILSVTDQGGYSIFLKSVAKNTLTQIKPPSGDYILNLWWSRDGSEVYFEQSGSSRTGLFAVSTQGGPIREVSKSADLLLGFSFDRDESVAVCTRTNPMLPNQVAVLDLKTGIPRTLVDLNPEFQNIALSPVTRLEWKNKYGITAHGHLVKPLNYEPGKRYPLIVTTYASGGFLRGATGDEYPIQVFAANGFAVLDFNEPPRVVVKDGDFTKAKMIWDSPMESLATAMKLLDDMGIIQADKRGLSGLSFGAEITAYTISHSNLFQAAAASQGAGRDPFSYDLLETAWQKNLSRWGLGGRPQGEAAPRWRELSAALNADRITAPLLIQISDSELLSSLMLYNALRELNKPIEMIVYADEGHVKSQPKHRYEIYQRNLEWFAFWLQGNEIPDSANNDQYKRWRTLKESRDKNRVSAR
jgi:dipeptidyl aminopeptidase/acylaminoacyl peptidase